MPIVKHEDDFPQSLFFYNNVQLSVRNYKAQKSSERKNQPVILSREKAIHRTRLRDDSDIGIVRRAVQ